MIVHVAKRKTSKTAAFVGRHVVEVTGAEQLALRRKDILRDANWVVVTCTVEIVKDFCKSCLQNAFGVVSTMLNIGRSYVHVKWKMRKDI